MQSSKKLGIKLLPTLLVLMSMLLVACGGFNVDNNDSTLPKSTGKPASIEYAFF